MHLKGLIAVSIISVKIAHYLLGQPFKALVLQNHHRTDSHNAEYAL